MKYEVKMSCGHTVTVELFGKSSEREKKLKYYEEHGLCPECYAEAKKQEIGCAVEEVEMKYAEYKEKYSDCKTKYNSYNRETKTIVVYVPVADAPASATEAEAAAAEDDNAHPAPIEKSEKNESSGEEKQVMETKNEIREMVEKYSISKFGSDKIRVGNICAAKRDDAADLIRSLKAEIMAYLDAMEAEKKASSEARKARIDAIEGLAELRDTMRSWEQYRSDFSRRMENEGMSSFTPETPSVTVEEIANKYPRAAAYVKAEGMSNSSHFFKASCGREALEKILNGDDCEKAISDAASKWDLYCKEHMFD